MFVGNGDYGQSVGVSFRDASLIDGILCKRTDREQFKLFSWQDAPVIEDETLSCDDLPPVLTKTYGGTTYKYEIVAARLEEDEEIGYSSSTFLSGQELSDTDEIPFSLFFTDDNGEPDSRFTVYEGASQYGPSSSAKVVAKTLSNLSHDAVVDEDSQFEWLNDNVDLRSDLEGREIVYAKVQRESDQSDHSFNMPIFLDSVTGEMILPDNSSNESTESNDSEESTDDAPVASDDDPVQDFYDTCEELDIDTEPAVRGLLDDMISDEDNDLTEDIVDRDSVVSDLVA